MFIKEKKGNNGVCRALIFAGQEIFGITMLLIMVSKGLGYSTGTILALWTIFNLYLSYKFKQKENKIFCIATLVAWAETVFGEKILEMNGYILL